MLQGEFEMYTSRVKLAKDSGTRWIDHKLWAMDCLIEKFGLYCVHLNNIISKQLKKKKL